MTTILPLSYQVSESTLDSGLGGSFLAAFLGDFLVLLAVLWHTHVLKIRGVWLARDPGMYNDEHIKRRATQTDQSIDQSLGLNKSRHEVVDGSTNGKDNTGITGSTTKAAPSGSGGDDNHHYHDLPLHDDDGQHDQKPASLKTGLWARLVEKVLIPCSFAFGLRVARTKPGLDFYVQIFFVQVVLFIVVIFGYQQTDHLIQSVKENQLSGSYLTVLFLHLVLIVVDRAIYLHRHIKAKVTLQFILLLFVYYLIHSNFTFRIGINQHGPLFAWYLVMCAYFYFSALQICYGYPPFIGGNWLTKHVHHMYGNFFRIYRAIPFLYELRMMLDWTCTSTTLYLGEWIKVEDISSGIFICECNLNWMQAEKRKKGQPQPTVRKWRTGFLFFVLLNLLVWLPLFIFSTGSLSNIENSVVAGSLSVAINGFPTLYAASTAEYISGYLPSSTWDQLVQEKPALALLPATSTADYVKELQYLRMPPASQEMWSISPPAEADLLRTLQSSADDVTLTLNFRFGTSDTSVSQGGVAHRLNPQEKADLAQVITGNRTSVPLTNVLPTLVRIASTKEVSPLLETVNKDCVLSFNTIKNSSRGIVGWWGFNCGSAISGCGDANIQQVVGNQASIVIAENEGGTCEPSYYTISSQKTIGSYLSFGYGIIGLYVTVVFTIGRFVHMSVMNMKYNIIYDDLPRLEVLKEIISTIYLARMYKNLILEEELYRELIDIYRRPTLLFERTGPYRHWLYDGDDIQSSYHQQVERDIAKYQ